MPQGNTRSSNKKFLSWAGVATLAAFKGCAGVRIQRTGVDSLAALMKRNALRLWNVASPHPEGAGWLLMNCSAAAVSGCWARNACTLAGSGSPVLGPPEREDRRRQVHDGDAARH